MSSYVDIACKYLNGSCTIDTVTEEFCNKIRNEIMTEILNHKLSERELEIQKNLHKEKEQYEKDKGEFYSNPIHWSNNKRKQHGLPVLRGKTNKNRSTKFHSFKLTSRMFFILEDIINETLGNEFNNNFFNQFVEVKDLK